ncbi:hypothetical protein scyTo_0015560 [Scyliorhinus torazame]|uniref:Uncharacterized protein n=1 Tax=Scyliorhinus torazame TaxID=75743 RepID=A0A401PUN0_SCYTO|nr:hypothetical protein [Scyliorhinus torazame]
MEFKTGEVMLQLYKVNVTILFGAVKLTLMSDVKMENSGIDVAAATKNLITLYGKMEVEEQVNFYDSWADDYDQHMSVMDYQAPRFQYLQ